MPDPVRPSIAVPAEAMQERFAQLINVGVEFKRSIDEVIVFIEEPLSILDGTMATMLVIMQALNSAGTRPIGPAVTAQLHYVLDQAIIYANNRDKKAAH